MGDENRNEKGQFEKGHAPLNASNPGGRPPKAREAALLAVAYEIVNAKTWRQIVTKRVLDALGKKQIATPVIRDKAGNIIKDSEAQLVDDERSTAQGRNLAASWLRDTVIGKPTEYLNLDAAGDSPYEQFAAYSTEQLQAILETIERIQSTGCGGITDTSRVDAPDGDGGAV